MIGYFITAIPAGDSGRILICERREDRNRIPVFWKRLTSPFIEYRPDLLPLLKRPLDTFRIVAFPVALRLIDILRVYANGWKDFLNPYLIRSGIILCRSGCVRDQCDWLTQISSGSFMFFGTFLKTS